MNPEPIELIETGLRPKRNLRAWLRRRVAGLFERDAGVWRFALGSQWLLVCAAVGVSAVGMPTGLGRPFDVGAGILLGTVAMALASILVAVALALAGAAKLPKLASGGFAYAGVLLYFVFYYAELGWRASLVFAILCSLAAAVAGLLVGLIVRAPARPAAPDSFRGCVLRGRDRFRSVVIRLRKLGGRCGQCGCDERSGSSSRRRSPRVVGSAVRPFVAGRLRIPFLHLRKRPRQASGRIRQEGRPRLRDGRRVGLRSTFEIGRGCASSSGDSTRRSCP